MAKPPTSETIAATLTPRERLTLLEIVRDAKLLNWEGGGEDAEKLIKKRLIRRGGEGSFSFTTRGRDVLLALFSAEARERNQPGTFAIGVDGQTGRSTLDVEGPASNPSDMAHQSIGSPQTNSTRAFLASLDERRLPPAGGVQYGGEPDDELAEFGGETENGNLFS